MENLYKRMVLLPEQEYIDMKQCNPSAEKTAAAIWPSESSSEREQKLYAINLTKQRESDNGRMIPSASSTTATSTTVSVTPDFTREITLLPTNFRARAQRLYTHLEKYRPSHLNWDTSGEVLFDRHSVPLYGSNLIDLIQQATSLPKRRNFTPIGWSEFVTVLRRTNTPTVILNKETREEVTGQVENTQTGKGLKIKPVMGSRKRTKKDDKKKVKIAKWIRV